jgi:hypothetical protein
MRGFGPDLDGDGVGEGLSDSFLAGGFVGVYMDEHGASCPRIWRKPGIIRLYRGSGSPVKTQAKCRPHDAVLPSAAPLYKFGLGFS